MSDLKSDVEPGDELLDELEKAVRSIIGNRKRKAEHLAAIGMGVKIAAIRHKIVGGDDSKGFFDK